MQSETGRAEAAATRIADHLAQLPAVIGGELAQPVAALGELLGALRSGLWPTASELASFESAVAHAHRIALQSQQISRLVGGRLRQSHERLALHTLVIEQLEGRRHQLRGAGVQVRHRLRPVEVIVDPGLLVGLLDAVLVWGMEHGRLLQISLHVKNWPEHAVLRVKASQPVQVQGDANLVTLDTLSWHLMMHTAQAMGVLVEREAASGQVCAQLEFPRTVKQLEGLTAIEMAVHSGPPSSLFSESKPMAGHRVLLVTTDSALRLEVQRVCEMLGLVLDMVAGSAQAVRHCERDRPHVIVVDELQHDAEFDTLRQDLVRADVNFPVIEIVQAADTFEMSNWMGDSVSRLGRSVVRDQLASIVVMELAKAS